MEVRLVSHTALHGANAISLVILTNRTLERRPDAKEEWESNLDIRLSPASIAEVHSPTPTRELTLTLLNDVVLSLPHGTGEVFMDLGTRS